MKVIVELVATETTPEIDEKLLIRLHKELRLQFGPLFRRMAIDDGSDGWVHWAPPVKPVIVETPLDASVSAWPAPDPLTRIPKKFANGGIVPSRGQTIV